MMKKYEVRTRVTVERVYHVIAENSKEAIERSTIAEMTTEFDVGMEETISADERP